MDPNIIMPFIKATRNIFETMLSMGVEIGDPVIKQAGEPSLDVSGIIGFTEGFEGAVILSFPEATALRLVSVFVGAEVTEPGEDLNDAIGELVNMIAGGAKAQFEGRHISISCPSVIYGKGHTVSGVKSVVTVVLPCECDCGDFALEIAVKDASGSPSASGAASVAGA